MKNGNGSGPEKPEEEELKEEEFLPAYHVKNLVKKSDRYQQDPNYEKSSGASSGYISKSQSKRIQGKEKHWMTKSTMIQGMFSHTIDLLKMRDEVLEMMGVFKEKGANANIYAEYWGREEDKLEYLLQKVPNETSIQQVFEVIDQIKATQPIDFKRLYELIPNFTNFAAQVMIPSILNNLTHFHQYQNQGNFFESLNKLIEDNQSYKQIIDFIEGNLPEAIKNINLKEQSSEIIGGKIAHDISGRKTAPKVRIVEDAENQGFKILSRIKPYEKNEEEGPFGQDMFEFYNEQSECLRNYGSGFLSPTEKKPIKGLLEAIIVRIFLGDNPNDIKMGNMIVIDMDDHYQVENIDFGNAFIEQYSLDQELFDPKTLISTINEIKSQIYQHGNDSLINIFLKKINNPKKEIYEAIHKIATLTNDHIRYAVGLSQQIIKEGVGSVYFMDYETILKQRRDQMQQLAQTKEFANLTQKPAHHKTLFAEDSAEEQEDLTTPLGAGPKPEKKGKKRTRSDEIDQKAGQLQEKKPEEAEKPAKKPKKSAQKPKKEEFRAFEKPQQEI